MRYRVPDHVAYIDGTGLEQGEVLYLTLLPHGQSVSLEGIGRLIWTVAADGCDVVAEIAELVGQPQDAIATDVTRFLGDMLDRGLLTAADDEVPVAVKIHR
jgi:Coenzyme PQQ synthesis protein D (PqqD)